MNTQPQAQQQDPSPNDPIAKLQKLKQLLEAGLITQEDFDKRKDQILDSM